MPADKTLRSQKRRARNNRIFRSFTKSRIRQASEMITEDRSSEDSGKSLKSAISALDRAVTKGIIHRNTAARKKSRLSRHFNSSVK